MNTINRRRTQLSVAAVAALAIFAVAAVMLLAGSFTTGPAQAQDTGGTGGDDTTPTSAPQPCGPGFPDANFPDNPADMVPSGHYALFDGYWLQEPGLADDTKTGTLNNNLCPPAAQHEDVTNAGLTTEVTTLSASNIDLRTTIIEVDDTHKVDVVASNAQAGTDKLSLERYMEVRKGLGLGKNDPVPAGTEVYWLRLEDPALGTDPSSLVLGFSTGQLDGDYWHQEGTDDDGNPLKPFQYEMESVRVLGAHPADQPHVLTYWEPEMRVKGKSVVVWDGANTDVNAMPLEAGEYEHLEWVFTKPGTYVLSVHLKGHVRQEKPALFDGIWERRTPDETVTSVPRQYVFHVGDLHINDQPHFGVSRTVTAGSPANTYVGDAIPVYGVDDDDLHYTLVGGGHEDFKVIERAGTHVGLNVQLTVADGAELRYPDPDRPYYDLHLRISDRHDYEDNSDQATDDVVAVRIHVLPSSGPWVAVRFSDEHPQATHATEVFAQVEALPNGAQISNITLYDGVGDQRTVVKTVSTNSHNARFEVNRDQPGTRSFTVVAEYRLNGQTKTISSALYPITWRH